MSAFLRIVLPILLAAPSATHGWAQKDTITGIDRIVAIGDIHGDLDALTQVLTMAGLVDSKGKWAGGKTHLVQVGDLPDRGPDTRKVIELLMSLEKQAKKAGGAVHVLIGNHDAMNMYGDLRYTTPAEFAAFSNSRSTELRDEYYKMQLEQAKPSDTAAFRAKFEKETPLGWVEQRQAWASDGEFGKWTSGHNTVLKVNDTLFVHAGISPRVVEMPMEDINKTIRRELINSSKLQGGLAMAEDGPLWYRGMATETGEQIGAHVDNVLKKYGVARVVIGHTPTKAPIVGRLGGRVIVVDVGLSRAYGGPKDCLIIEGGKLYTVASGNKRPLNSQP